MISETAKIQRLGQESDDVADIVWNHYCGHTSQAECRLREMISEGILCQEDVEHVAGYMCRCGNPEYGLELIKYCKSMDYYWRFQLKFHANRRLSRRSIYRTLRPYVETLYRPKDSLRRVMSPYSKKFRDAQRLAVMNYPKLIEQLREMVSGRRVLLLASGPSAAAVNSVPEDVVIFCVNRSIVKLEAFDLEGRDIVWLMGRPMGANYWNHTLDISKRIPEVKLVLFDFMLGRAGRLLWGPHHWLRRVKGWRFSDRVAFLPKNDRSILGKVGLEKMSAVPGACTNGTEILKYLISLTPSEIYLAGIDIGYSGKQIGDQTYFYQQERFTDRRGKELRSTQRSAHPMDEILIREISQLNLPIYSVSPESRVARYFETKSLQ